MHLTRADVIDSTMLPADAIQDCSHSGACDSDVEYWQKQLAFTVDRADAIRYLKATGGWTEPELTGLDDVSLAHKVLWLACNDLREAETRGEDRIFIMEG